MKKCPYCKEEIQKDAIKCKHCGSSLEELSVKVERGMNSFIKGWKSLKETSEETEKKEIGKFDYSNIKRYKCTVRDKNGNRVVQIKNAKDETKVKQDIEAESLMLLKYKLIQPRSKISCPRCGSLYVERWLDIEQMTGTLILLIVLSFGLFLVLVLLADVLGWHTCNCKICGYDFMPKLKGKTDSPKRNLPLRCPHCGKQYDDSWKICLYCSSQLVKDETPASS